MNLAFKYRLFPSQRQHRALEAILEAQRQLYNAARQERIDCYRKTGKTLSNFDQQLELTICRKELPEMGAISRRIQCCTLKRLDLAFKAFFCRAKRGKAGYPRFKGKEGWNGFGLDTLGAGVVMRLDGKRIRFKGMPGGLKVHFHRPLPDNPNIRSCDFHRDVEGWSVCFQVAVETVEKRAISTAVGVDLGLNVFAYCSDGQAIPNPRIARKAEKEIRCRSRALARCKKGSKRRLKVKAQFARAHRNVANKRAAWLHQKSTGLIKRVDFIAVEDLKTANLMRNNHLARSIADASWAKFIYMLEYKAEKAGVQFIRVNPKYTSQKCSGCGEIVPKSLNVRTHSCSNCGLTLDRDLNAAQNILRAGLLSAGYLTWPSGASVYPETQIDSSICKPSRFVLS